MDEEVTAEVQEEKVAEQPVEKQKAEEKINPFFVYLRLILNQ